MGVWNGPNLYAYVKQNPWSKFDPLGLWWREALSTGLDFIPIVSTVKTAVEFVTGRDLITGEAVSGLESGASFGSIINSRRQRALKTAKIARQLTEKALEVNGKVDAVMAIADDVMIANGDMRGAMATEMRDVRRIAKQGGNPSKCAVKGHP